MQNPSIQPGVFLTKMWGRVWVPKLGLAEKAKINVFFYLLSSYELLAYFHWFAVSKSLRTEVFHSGLVYYQWGCHKPGNFMVSSKISREHPSQLKLASSLALKALASKSFSGVK